MLLLIAVFVAAFLFASVHASGQEPIGTSITGPTGLAPGQATTYNLTISGGPSGPANYTVQWYVTADDTTGALPVSSNPSRTSGSQTAFRLNITAPTKEETITLVAKVSAQGGGTTENASVEKSIVVITPITLSATFRNDGPTAAVNVTVRFYVDGSLVGTKSVTRINPNGQANVAYPYLPVGLQPGSHTVRIEADLDGNGVIDPARGEAVLSDLFYRGTPTLSTGWTVLIGIGVFVPVLLFTIAFRRRQRS